MEENVKKVDNSSYHERFQFQLLTNDNIICQRYFKIPKFNSESLVSEELYDTLDYVVSLVQNDLISKSRIYLSNIYEQKTKLTGFASKQKALKEAKENNADESVIRDILLRTEDDETFVLNDIKEWDEQEFVEYGDITFKFKFMVDDREVYVRIWDGSKYPKYVRNSVDITNAKSFYPMLQLMNSGKPDLVVEIINEICKVCSNVDDETPNKYTKSVRYGVDKETAKKSKIDVNTFKKYSYSIYNKEYVNSWKNYIASKNK